MSSYKPVIYIFGALGLLSVIGLSAITVQGIRGLSGLKSDYSNDYMLDGDMGLNMDTFLSDDAMDSATGSSRYPNYGEIRATDPDATEIDDRPSSSTSMPSSRAILYSAMEDDSIMRELKLPDQMDQTLRTLLGRPDTSLQELFESDTKRALKMTSLDEERESIIIQDLKTGDIYDTGINAHANFKFMGQRILHLIATPARPDELTQIAFYDIETNQTTNQPALPEGFSYTKKVDTYGPVGNLVIKNMKVEVSVYPTKDFARFDADRTAVRTETF